MSSDTERAIEEILNDFERQPVQDKRTFRAYLNQPELISLSSTNAQQQSPPISPLSYAQYYNFTINLPRPALDAKSLQLLKAVIPQAQCSLPDYSLVFPYYRLRTVPRSSTDGDVYFVDNPNFAVNNSNNNLYFIRLLPSYYKKEELNLSAGDSVDDFGYNQTFNDYNELEKELKKSCAKDLRFTIYQKYIANDISIEYKPNLNRFVLQGNNTNTVPVINNIQPWVSNVNYLQGDLVFYNLNFYIARNASVGVPPNPNNDLPWSLQLYPTYYTTFVSNQDYYIGNVVQHVGIFYYCKQNAAQGDDAPPDNPTSWLNVSQYFATNPNFNSYLIAGYQDPNVDSLLKYINFKSEALFSDNIGVSIPGQPYAKYQTLARRLGFTWDGTGMINDVSRINYLLNEQGIPFGSTVALFFNRFRPVLNYDIGLEAEQKLGAANNVISYYTADGYCNLVYSSVISIYTTIVGTSTVDTQRNANLLAMIPMDCGNLGVAMVGNYIENALTKIQGDLYSIYIELRDENGEPYYLTNNATTTLLIKLTY